MSECIGQGCTHPEHVDPLSVTALAYQHRPTHLGERLANEYYAARRSQRDRIRDLFGTGQRGDE